MRGGYYNYNGNLYYQFSYNLYWLRRLDNATNGYGLSFGSGYVNPQSSNNRGYGFSLRCLALEEQANSTPILAPLSLVREGHYFYGSGILGNQSSYGYYWSRQLNSAALSYYLLFYSGNVYPQNSSGRGYGFALRCHDR